MRFSQFCSFLVPLCIACTAIGCAASQAACGASSELGCVDPVSETSRRKVVEPLEVVTLDARSKRAQLGEVVTFGGRAGGATRLYLRFGNGWKSPATIERAFVVLEPVRATPPESQEIIIEAWRIRDTWKADALRWFAQPNLVGPRSEARVRPNSDVPLYIDVTELLQQLAKRRDDNGILLLSTSSGTYGASYRTGASGGLPRLEVYFAK